MLRILRAGVGVVVSALLVVALMALSPAAAVAAPKHDTAQAGGNSSVWDRLARCESSGNWKINSGNGYYGGLQISKSTWNYYGGRQFAAYPNQTSRSNQIVVAQRILNGHDGKKGQGWKAWPTCSRRIGVR